MRQALIILAFLVALVLVAVCSAIPDLPANESITDDNRKAYTIERNVMLGVVSLGLFSVCSLSFLFGRQTAWLNDERLNTRKKYRVLTAAQLVPGTGWAALICEEKNAVSPTPCLFRNGAPPPANTIFQVRDIRENRREISTVEG